MRKLTLEDVEKELEYAQKHNPELKKFHLTNADARVGKRVALAEKREHGVLDVRTDFLSYSEMVYYLHGYSHRGENRYK